MSSALRVKTRMLAAATLTLLCITSTSAPAGTWLAMATTVPRLRAVPIAVWVQPWVVRWTAMKGPKPVWTFATDRLSQSRPYPAAIKRALASAAYGCGPAIAPVSLGCMRGRRRFRRRSRLLCWRGGRGRFRRSDDVDCRRSRLVFGGILHVGANQAQLDRSSGIVGCEFQQVPVDRDLAAADAEETAEIDHCGARPAVLVHQNIDDQTHVFTGRAEHLFAENALGLGAADGLEVRQHRRRLRASAR